MQQFTSHNYAEEIDDAGGEFVRIVQILRQLHRITTTLILRHQWVGIRWLLVLAGWRFHLIQNASEMQERMRGMLECRYRASCQPRSLHRRGHIHEVHLVGLDRAAIGARKNWSERALQMLAPDKREHAGQRRILWRFCIQALHFTAAQDHPLGGS